MNSKINWLASYPKSGNTWVRMFLNAYKSGNPVDINSPFQYVISDTDSRMMQTISCISLEELPMKEQFTMRPAALVNTLYCYSQEGIVLKTHNAKVKVLDMPIIPLGISGTAIYIIRDPRDIAISYAKHLGITIDKIIDKMNNPESATLDKYKLMHLLLTWSLHVKSWTTLNKDIDTLIIRYEDLLSQPIPAFKAIIKQLNLSYDDRRFRFALEQSKFKNLQKLEQENKFREIGLGNRFFDKGVAGRWKEVLTKKQDSQIQEHHGEVMELFKYLEMCYA